MREETHLGGGGLGDVRPVDGDGLATLGDGGDAAHSEACSTGGVRLSSDSLQTLNRR